MCGIAGYTSNIDLSMQLNLAVSKLQHRGPNNTSVFKQNNVALGHTRLSIIDLSSQANQPMKSSSGRYIIVYNGEIYNYKELIISNKLKMQTNSDTEVILQLFEMFGNDFVNQLNGMFAIAIFDTQTETIHFFRDRLGKKPLFYFKKQETLIFASELKALMTFEIVNKNLEINHTTIPYFLQLGYIPEPYTFFKNIFKFPSASFGEYKNNNLEIKKYWNIEDKIEANTHNNYNNSLKKLNELLNDSISKRLISDVPLGVFLSGGVDSSLIAAIAQKQLSAKLNTFSIGFENKKFNETAYAQQVAEKIGTNHTTFIVKEHDILENFDRFFETFDEPFADSSGFPTMLVSKLAKEKVSVSLTGDGGDELFNGYGMYNWAKRLNNPIISTFRYPISITLKTFGNRYKRVSNIFNYNDIDKLKTHIFSQEQYYFSENELNSVLKNTESIIFDEKINTKRKLTSQEEQALFDVKNYLKDDLLVKNDRASMQFALETRAPLLDYRIVEFAINLNPNFKIKNGVQKYILKDVLYQYLPKEIFDRPKWGFSIPLNNWLKNDINYILEKYTSQQIVEKFNIFNYSKINELKNKYYAGETYLYNRLWLVIVLHKFLEKYTVA